ncbi:MAG TPA: polyhydroxyalkanoate synthesis regulator DNA-binding domain-containing protein [Kofleriaceae bacterium]|jgi:polyhydroxyalkanoate synthesis repressor PhaR
MAPTVIKKYGNRRLYDTGDSKYVTLDELATKIRSGVDVRVIGAEGGEDLTQATLTQIVLETGNAAKFLPTQLLMQMIRLSDDSLAEFFSRYVTSALDIYLGAKRGVQSISGLNPLTQIPVAATDALARMWMGGMGGFSPFQQGYPQQGGYPAPQQSASFVPAPPPPAEDAPPERKSERGMNGGAPADDKNDVGAMRRELDELKQMIRDGLGGGGAAAAKKKRKRTDGESE